MILTLTPYVFSGIQFVPGVLAPQPIVAPGIAFFVLSILLIPFGVVLLIKKFLIASGEERRQFRYLFIGVTIMFSCILFFDFVLPAFFGNTQFIPLSAVFTFPFVAFTAYAIYYQHLFNLKVATTVFLGFMVTVFTFVNVLYSTSASGVVINVTAFLIVLLGSIKIVRDTLTLQELTEELGQTNARQEGLIHFISHEVKGFLTKDAGVFASLSEGDFGELPEATKSFVGQALAESRLGADSVANILKASNLKKGTTSFKKEPFDLATLAIAAVEKVRAIADRKKLMLTFTADPAGAPYTFTGDKDEIGDHVFRNLVDNAVNYTPSGSIAASLKKENNKFIFAVKDSGVGITEEDKKRLFTEGGHGKDSIRVNVHSTGYGLYIAKNITEAHGGTIRAESEGEGKGSTFIVELPAN